MRLAPLFMLSLFAAPAFCQEKSGDGWVQDFAKAKAEAAAQKKDLLVDFTGSDWCSWCIKLDKEVFAKEEFRTEASKHFVFVKLDFPRNKELVTAEIAQQNALLKGEYWTMQGYPTIFLMDASGKPYAQTGYQQGGPTSYNAHLAELRAVREARDAAMTKVDALKGVERAKALIAALDTLPDELRDAYYGKEMQEVVALDAKDELNMKAMYEEAITKATEARTVGVVDGTFSELAEAAKWDEALTAMDKVVKDHAALKTVVQKALFYKAVALAQGKQDFPGAIEAVKKAIEAAPDSEMGKRLPGMLMNLEKEAAKRKEAGGDGIK